MKLIKSRTRRDNSRNWFGLYECDCGKRFETREFMVRSGRTRSCGCLKPKLDAKRMTLRNTSHGMTGTPTYRSWLSMRARCRYPSATRWKHYGGRGIKVCDRWQTFENFLADMGERPPGMQLGRIDNDGDYEPRNVRWQLAADNQREKNARVKPWEFTRHGKRNDSVRKGL